MSGNVALDTANWPHLGRGFGFGDTNISVDFYLILIASSCVAVAFFALDV